MLQTLNLLPSYMLNLLQNVHVSLVYGGPKRNRCAVTTDEQMGKDHPPQPAGDAPTNTTQNTISLLCQQSTLLAHGQLFVHQDPQVLLYKASSQPFGPSLYWCMGLFLTKHMTLQFPLLNFMRFFLAHSSSLSRLLRTAAKPSGATATLFNFLLLANFLRVHSDLSSRSLTKRLNSYRSSGE